MSRKRHVTLTPTNADLQRWLANNLLEVSLPGGLLTYVAIPKEITNVSQLAHYIKYDLLIDEHPYLSGLTGVEDES